MTPRALLRRSIKKERKERRNGNFKKLRETRRGVSSYDTPVSTFLCLCCTCVRKELQL